MNLAANSFFDLVFVCLIFMSVRNNCSTIFQDGEKRIGLRSAAVVYPFHVKSAARSAIAHVVVRRIDGSNHCLARMIFFKSGSLVRRFLHTKHRTVIVTVVGINLHRIHTQVRFGDPDFHALAQTVIRHHLILRHTGRQHSFFLRIQCHSFWGCNRCRYRRCRHHPHQHNHNQQQ